MNELNAISPIDGRYNKHTEELSQYFSEKALIKYRIMVEGEYLINLSELEGVGPRKFAEEEIKLIRDLAEISDEDAEIVKKIELEGHEGIKATNHDVKAVEYYMKMKLAKTSLSDSLEWVHFALTSEDTNNLAHALALTHSRELVIVPWLEKISAELENFAEQYAQTPMLSRTHGQPASPTTVGKEFKVFAHRIERQLTQLKNQKIQVKLNGATGNYNAHQAAYPKVDWPVFTENFIAGLGVGPQSDRGPTPVRLELNPLTTQIEPHDSYAELFDNLRRINIILIDFAQDMWRYISDNWIVQKAVEGEVGSSTMPHKINPIDFENAEGNLGLANSLFTFFSAKLPVSRLQRDLSDSTVERNFGVAFGHCLIAYKSLLKGLGKISVNEAKVKAGLEAHPEVVAEAIQTILRREGVEMPYEKLKALTRGKEVSMSDIAAFIDSLEISDELKKELKQITPSNYIGLASKLTQQ